MRKAKIASVLLITSLVLISFGNFSLAQGSSYIGISEGEEYIWDLGIDQVGVNSLLDDSEIYVQELLNDILTLDLGAYTDLNVSEAILLGFNNSFGRINEIFPPGIIPEDWKTINISAFMENVFDKVVETFNSSYLSGAIPDDWKSDSIVDFFDHVIEGLNKTIPGFESFTLVEVLESVINLVNDTIPCDLLPVGWEDMILSDLIELTLVKPLNFINTTILPGLIPSNWFHMDIAPLLQKIFPILPQTLIDQLDAMYSGYYDEFSIFTFIDLNVQSLNFSLGGLIPGNWDEYTISEIIEPFFFGYADYNVSYVFNEFFESLNSSIPFDLYSVNMSSLINMTIYGMTYGLTTEQQSAPTLDLFRDQVSSMVLAINSTYPVGTFPDDWMSLTIDQLRIYYVNQSQLMFEQLMTQVEGYLNEFEILGGFEKLSLKATVDYIGDEIELIPGGPKGVPINISIEIKVPLSDWVNLTDMLGIDIFQYYPIYILDPTTFKVDGGALVEQFLSTGGLFIGKGYDWSGIVKDYEILELAPNKFLNIDMDWNSNGVLDHISLEYGGQAVMSIELRTTSTEPELISGYDLIIFTGITLFSMGAILISIKKRKTKF